MKKIILFLIVILYSSCQNLDKEESYSKKQNSDLTVKEDSFIKVYYESGSLKAIYTVNDDGINDGEARQFYPSGKLWHRTFFKNGLRVGKNIVYYENYQIHIEENISDNGELDGRYVEYYENGIIKEIGTYSEGMKTGEWKVYWDNGVINEIGYFEKDKRVGEQRLFHPNGELGLKGKSIEGLKEGLWIFFDTNSDTLKVETYKKDVLLSTKVYKESEEFRLN
jgi:antitoxin component YwqK of YwqJK toxin-antitoxin module